MKIIGKYWKLFLLRGLVAMGFGPIVLAIVYAILELSNVTASVSVREITVGILTMTALAFLCGAVTQVFQIEEAVIHGAVVFRFRALDGVSRPVRLDIIFILYLSRAQVLKRDLLVPILQAVNDFQILIVRNGSEQSPREIQYF